MTVIHILIGMFNSNPMIPQYLKLNLRVNIHRYTPITLYPTAPLYDIIIIFDTVLRQKRICKREK